MTPEQKQLLKLQNFANTPDIMLQQDKTGETQMFDALKRSAISEGSPVVVDNAPGADAGEAGATETPETHTTAAPPIAPPQFEASDPAAKYGNAVKPAKLINFKLKELLDPELIIMILDMLLSWGGSALLSMNDINVTSEQLQADEMQRQILLKAFNPLFETYEVGTNNPAIGIVLAMTAVYGKNITVAINEHKKQIKAVGTGEAYTEPKRKKARYSVKPRAPRAKKTTIQSQQTNF